MWWWTRFSSRGRRREAAARAGVFMYLWDNWRTMHSPPRHRDRSCSRSSSLSQTEALLVFWCLNGQLGAERTGGVTRPCYSCNISRAHCMFSYSCTSLYTCVWMHMLTLHCLWKGVKAMAAFWCPQCSTGSTWRSVFIDASSFDRWRCEFVKWQAGQGAAVFILFFFFFQMTRRKLIFYSVFNENIYLKG